MFKVGDLITFIDKLLQGVPQSQRIGVVVSDDIYTDASGRHLIAVRHPDGSWGHRDLEQLRLVARGE